MIGKPALFGLVVTAAVAISASHASDQQPRWSGWQLDIDNNDCTLTNEFRVHPSALHSNGGFLTGTSFEKIRLIIIAKTHSRDADRYRLGEAMLRIHIKSHVDLSPPDRIDYVIFGGQEMAATDFGERAPGDQMNERHAYFWFHDNAANSLISRLVRGESLALSFIARSGNRALDTTFANQRNDRFGAWESAFRGCAMANRE